uniref:Ig-like domain-containing protein n=1 Tax=Anopheles atroparvus TaxID=41427 RepID=A0A182JLU3_ANOAO
MRTDCISHTEKQFFVVARLLCLLNYASDYERTVQAGSTNQFKGTLVLLWRRGSNVLTASQLMVTRDERIRLVNGYNLEISELEPQDAGDYVCQISDKVNKDQVHTVEILASDLAD